MFGTYMEKEAFAPLVAEFRKWNWEWSYDDHLLTLTSSLQENRDWPLLQELWAAVVAKRRTNYNKTRQAQKAFPDKIPEDSGCRRPRVDAADRHRAWRRGFCGIR